MKKISLNSDQIFIPALLLSAFVHAILISANGWMPSSADVSVLQAPNSLEFTVISQPLVTVIEDEIVIEEINEIDIFDTFLARSSTKKNIESKSRQPTISSRESLGAVTKAKPLMDANLAPPYPKIARQRGWEGTVRLNIFVEKNGDPDQVMVQQSSGHQILDNAALKTVKRWKFSPAQSGQLRFSSKIIVPIQFTLLKEK